jgi:hypothetical protein
MGEKQNQPFQLSFNASLEVDFQESRVASDGGLILVHELEERLSSGKLITKDLTDSSHWIHAGLKTQPKPSNRGRLMYSCTSWVAKIEIPGSSLRRAV